SQRAVAWLAGNIYTGTGQIGSWNAASSWTAGIPVAGSDVLVVPSSGSSHEVDFDNPNPVQLGNITVDDSSYSLVELAIAQSTLSATGLTIGVVGAGSVYQGGGTVTLSGSMVLASQAGSIGFYSLNNGNGGGLLQVGGDETVGASGNGSIGQSAG